MKKVIFLIFIFFIASLSLKVLAVPLPPELQESLLEREWRGFITHTDSSDGKMAIEINFILDENKTISCTVTMFGVEMGERRYNFTRFGEVSYDYLNSALIIKYPDPTERVRKHYYRLYGNRITKRDITGLVYYETENKVFTIGSFRISK